MRCFQKEVLEALKNILYWALTGQYQYLYRSLRTLISVAYVTPCKKGQSNCDSPSRMRYHVIKDKAGNHKLKEDLKQKQLIQTVFPTPHTVLILQVQVLCKIVLPASQHHPAKPSGKG